MKSDVSFIRRLQFLGIFLTLTLFSFSIQAVEAIDSSTRSRVGGIPGGGTTAPRFNLIDKLQSDDDSVIFKKLTSQTPLKKGGENSDILNQKIVLANKTQVSLGHVSKKIFKDQNLFIADMKKISIPSGILAREPQTNTEVYEYNDSFVMVKSTSIVVSKPAELAATSPIFKNFLKTHLPKNKLVVKLSSLNAEGQAGLDDYIANKIPNLPDNDPLKIAHRQGKEALLQAMADGQGEFEVIESVMIPKVIQPVTDSDVNSAGSESLDQAMEARLVETPTIKEEGKFSFHTQFMAGFSKGAGFHWEKRWNFPSGFFRLTVGASYGIGFRIPIDVQGEVSPTEITVRGDDDGSRAMTTKIKTEIKDADANFYKEVGVPHDLIFDGHEAVLKVEFGYGYRFRALWQNIKYKRFSSIGYKCEEDFKNVHGLNFDDIHIPIPLEVTRSEIDLGVLGGYVQVGLKLSGEGEIAFDYQPFMGSKSFDEKTLHFTNTHYVSTISSLPALTGNADKREEKYGFTLSNPKYKLDFTITPELKFAVWVDFDWVSHTFDTDWFGIVDIPLGSITFDRHKGTRKEYKFADGIKKFEKLEDYTGNVGDLVALQSIVSKSYVRAAVQSNGAYGVDCDSLLAASEGDINTWETFKLTKLGSNKVSLEALNSGKYVRAGISEYSFLGAMSDRASTWETFEMTDLGGNQIALKAINNKKYVRAGIGQHGESLLGAQSNHRSTWETFKLWPASWLPIASETETYSLPDEENVIALQSNFRHRYVRAGIVTNSYVGAMSDRMEPWTFFKVVKQPEGKVLLKSIPGKKYIRVISNNRNYLYADHKTKGSLFKIIELGNDQIALQYAKTGKYVAPCLTGGGLLSANSDHIGELEKFVLKTKKKPQAQTEPPQTQSTQAPQSEDETNETVTPGRLPPAVSLKPSYTFPTFKPQPNASEEGSDNGVTPGRLPPAVSLKPSYTFPTFKPQTTITPISQTLRPQTGKNPKTTPVDTTSKKPATKLPTFKPQIKPQTMIYPISQTSRPQTGKNPKATPVDTTSKKPATKLPVFKPVIKPETGHRTSTTQPSSNHSQWVTPPATTKPPANTQKKAGSTTKPYNLL